MFWLSEFFFIILLLLCALVFKLFFYNSIFANLIKEEKKLPGTLNYSGNLIYLVNYFILSGLTK